ncbi:zinc finger protein 22-like [Pollicipes pollicipes]|uniref:zinc finger protein 22-like n=1 Tax=Pollicipes pollicipes TaxID=41117 RepID=UPI001884A917|nr:zinc finger protein 22-like [Pollicipes pollicipes]
MAADAVHPVPPLPGPSHRLGEDGSQIDSLRCESCGRCFSNRDSLVHHRKVHAGVTTCALCGKVLNKVAYLRVHLQLVHRLDEQRIRAMVPTRRRYTYRGT